MDKELEDTMHRNFGHRLRVRVCGIITQNNKILLLKQKAKTTSGHLWLPPGGGLEYGESLSEALTREVLEETNLTVESKELYGVTEFIDSPFHAIELFYNTTILSGEVTLGTDPELIEDNQLIQEVKWMSLEEVRNIDEESKHEILQNREKLKTIIK